MDPVAASGDALASGLSVHEVNTERQEAEADFKKQREEIVTEVEDILGWAREKRSAALLRELVARIAEVEKIVLIDQRKLLAERALPAKSLRVVELALETTRQLTEEMKETETGMLSRLATLRQLCLERMVDSDIDMRAMARFKKQGSSEVHEQGSGIGEPSGEYLFQSVVKAIQSGQDTRKLLGKITKALTIYAKIDDVNQHCVRALLALLRADPRKCKLVVELGTLKKVMRAMRKEYTSAVTVKIGLDLMNLVAGDATLCDKLIADGGHTVALMVLRRDDLKKVAILASAASFLNLITESKSLRNDAGILVSSRLVVTIRANFAHTQVLRPTLAALRNLARIDDLRHFIVDEDGVAVLIGVLEKAEPSPLVLSSALSCLMNCSMIPEARAQVGTRGIAAILHAMGGAPRSEAVQEAAAGALFNITGDLEEKSEESKAAYEKVERLRLRRRRSSNTWFGSAQTRSTETEQPEFMSKNPEEASAATGAAEVLEQQAADTDTSPPIIDIDADDDDKSREASEGRAPAFGAPVLTAMLTLAEPLIVSLVKALNAFSSNASLGEDTAAVFSRIAELGGDTRALLRESGAIAGVAAAMMRGSAAHKTNCGLHTWGCRFLLSAMQDRETQLAALRVGGAHAVVEGMEANPLCVAAPSDGKRADGEERGAADVAAATSGNEYSTAAQAQRARYEASMVQAKASAEAQLWACRVLFNFTVGITPGNETVGSVQDLLDRSMPAIVEAILEAIRDCCSVAQQQHEFRTSRIVVPTHATPQFMAYSSAELVQIVEDAVAVLSNCAVDEGWRELIAEQGTKELLNWIAEHVQIVAKTFPAQQSLVKAVSTLDTMLVQ